MTRIPFIPAALLIALTACDGNVLDGNGTPVDGPDGNDAADPVNDPDVNEPSAARSTASGVVTEDANIDTVAMFEVQADGSVRVVSDEAEVGADGSYSLSFLSESDGGQRFIGDASGSLVGAVLVHFESDEGSEHTAGDIDLESTVETQLFLDLVFDGRADEDGSVTGFIQAVVDADVSSDSDADADQEGSIDAMADVIAGIIVSLDLSDAELDAMTDVQADIDAEGSGDSEADSRTALDALLDIGLSEDDLFLTAHIAAETSSSVAANADEDADGGASAIAQGMTEIRAHIATDVVADVMTTLDLSLDTQGDVEDANDGLLDSILDADSSLGVDLDVSAMFDEWASDISSMLTLGLSVDGLTQVQDADDAASEAEADLDLAIDLIVEANASAEEQAESMTEAMLAYQAQIETDVRVEAMADGELGEDGASAMTDLLIQLHASLDGDIESGN